jgi:hypothetical protein
MATEDALQAIREQLLSHRPPLLEPEQGAEAFQQHRLLATTVHQATLLDKRAVESQTGAWIRYFTDYFPAPRNGEADANLLWREWRTSLLKDGAPGERVLVTHGQPPAHWHRDADRLCINLECMWDDFAESVERFLDFVRAKPERAAIVVPRAQRGRVGIVTFDYLSTATIAASAMVGPVTASATSASVAAVTQRVKLPPKSPEK